MLRFARAVPADASPEAFAEARAQVRAHLSAVADADDHPDTRADDVTITVTRDGDGNALTISGELDAPADAPYLRDDFDPDGDTEFTYQPWEGVQA